MGAMSRLLPLLLVLAACDPAPPPEDAGTDAPRADAPRILPDVPLPDAGTPDPVTFGAMGPLIGSEGADGFRFGVATAATQIEDMNASTDWYVWSQPVACLLYTSRCV